MKDVASGILLGVMTYQLLKWYEETQRGKHVMMFLVNTKD